MSMVTHRVMDAVTSGRQPEPPDVLAEADAARDAGRFSDAAALFERHIAAHPDAAGAMVQAGHMRKESGSLAEAEAHYRAALELLPNDFDLHLQLGHFYKVAGQFEKAGRFYVRASELQPGSAEAKAEASHVALLMVKPEAKAEQAPVIRARTAAEDEAAEFARNVPAAQFGAVLDEIVTIQRHFLLAGVEQRSRILRSRRKRPCSGHQRLPVRRMNAGARGFDPGRHPGSWCRRSISTKTTTSRSIRTWRTTSSAA